MAKKSKVGKQRRDKYYRLAKEAGYRSRAAFKLVQLNRKFEFLQKSQVVVDLCAAPGGWLQVAAESTPVSSIIIGVDLVPIKPINNVISLQQDITTEACRQSVQKELKTWEADCVLHDGAPNVGKNWQLDAFSQAQLVLSALKLAVEILRKGGWFVTKIFRSKDYTALLLVFKELFKKVHATKPQASRNESAEIFVVCQGFRKPAKVDPQLLDGRFVFKESQLDPKIPKLNVLHPEKKRLRAEGYAEGDYTVYHCCSAENFVKCDNFLELLGKTSEVVLDNDLLINHPKTTPEIRECFKDIQVLGRKELRDILTWRKAVRSSFLASVDIQKEDTSKVVTEAANQNVAVAMDSDDAELTDIVLGAEAEEKLSVRRQKKKEQKAKKRRQLSLDMQLPGDKPDYEQHEDLFNLSSITKQMSKSPNHRLRYTADEHGMEEYGEVEPAAFVVADEDKLQSAKAQTDMWFSQEAFADVDLEEEEDLEIENLIQLNANSKGDKGKAFQSDHTERAAVVVKQETDEVEEKPSLKRDVSELQVVKRDKRVQLDAEALALGSLLVHSSKAKRDIVEHAYNRYTNNDENLPRWFVDDEKKHYRKALPVSKELVAEYKTRQTAIDARTIKKVGEAKARKKKRAMRRIEKARKKTGAVMDNPELTDREKSAEMKKIYKKAGVIKQKKPVTYVVAKKGGGKRVQRPAGVSGRFKVVDPRMKKDSGRSKRNPKAKR